MRGSDNHTKLLTQRLRESLNLSKQDASDTEILELAKGSLLVERIELGIALDNFVEVVKSEIKIIHDKLLGK